MRGGVDILKKNMRGKEGVRCCWMEDSRSERLEVRRRGAGELSICTNLRICHMSVCVFFTATLRWF